MKRVALRHRRSKLSALSLALACVAASALADIELPAIFSDHMVLQREMKVPVWGKAEPGEKVTVTFRDASASAAADAQGNWRVKIGPFAAGAPGELTVAGKNTLTIKDVLVGEVWLCSGQSNMQMDLRSAAGGEEEAAKADFPSIRYFNLSDRMAEKPDWKGYSQWQVCTPKAARGFSAVAFFFGRQLHQTLNVPVALIENAVNGSLPEAWMPRALLAADPDFSPILDRYNEALKTWPEKKADYDAKRAAWIAAQTKAQKEGTKNPLQHPALPMGPENPKAPAVLYNAMLSPLIGYGVRGVAWYQGEHSVDRAWQYRKLLPAMVRHWRAEWGQGELPFLIVQLPGLGQPPAAPGENPWAELREAQWMTSQSVTNVGMVVSIDVGEVANIHPFNKRPVGERLALTARALVYGEKIVYSGPVFKW